METFPQTVLYFEYAENESHGVRLPKSELVVHFPAWLPADPLQPWCFYIFVDLILTKSNMERTFNIPNFKGTKLDQRAKAQIQEFTDLK